MRRVERDWNDKPAILESSDTLAEIEALANDSGRVINDSIYKDSYEVNGSKSFHKVRDKLNEYYYGKCAYCEGSSNKAEIEHYRPKKRITDEKGHPGYYWLAYEWSNLLPSCRYCNTEGGKGNHFTIAGIRVEKPVFLPDGKLDRNQCLPNQSPLKDELPYLLHPEIDYPQLYLGFILNNDKTGVKIIPIDLSKVGSISRGSETIRICNLNRPDLQIDRLRDVLSTIKEHFQIVFTLFAQGTINIDGLIHSLKLNFSLFKEFADNKEKTHTLLWWYITSSEEHFRTVALPIIEDENQKKIVNTAFQIFLQEQTTHTV